MSGLFCHPIINRQHDLAKVVMTEISNALPVTPAGGCEEKRPGSPARSREAADSIRRHSQAGEECQKDEMEAEPAGRLWRSLRLGIETPKLGPDPRSAEEQRASQKKNQELPDMAERAEENADFMDRAMDGLGGEGEPKCGNFQDQQDEERAASRHRWAHCRSSLRDGRGIDFSQRLLSTPETLDQVHPAGKQNGETGGRRSWIELGTDRPGLCRRRQNDRGENNHSNDA
jgi:hypothetical protein